MKRSLLRPQVLLPGIAAAICLYAPASRASTWSGAGSSTASWSSNGIPGWNGTGVPDGQGAVADFNSASSTTNQDTGATVTVGTIRKVAAAPNSTWTINPTHGITLDQDGAGMGSALIENATTSTGGHRLTIGSGTLTLADDLLIRNSGGANGSSGSISITANIAGTGNITFDNVSNNASAGQITLLGATQNISSFTGNILIRRGAVTFNDKDNFGNQATNVITLGATGQGGTTLVSSSAISGAIVNNIVSAAGTGGTNVLGSVSTSTTASTVYAGTVLLNGNLTLTSANTDAANVTLSGVVSGIGSLVKSGTGIARLSGVNTYTGDTTVSEGTLLLAAGGEQRFVIQDGGLSNQLQFSGTSALDLNGTLRLDISGLTASSGIWNLVVDSSSTIANYGGGFGLAFVGGPAFVNGGSGTYTSGNWTFDTASGSLSLVPEPGIAGLLALGGAAITLFRRRREKA